MTHPNVVLGCVKLKECMKNYWLDEAKNKVLFSEITKVLEEVWSNDGTFAEFIDKLSDEQTYLFLKMKIKDVEADEDNFDLAISLSK